MTDQADIVPILLFDREYKIKCPREKMPELQQAAGYLDAKMREAADNVKTLNKDSLFMIAALNIASELVNVKQQKNSYIDHLQTGILGLRQKIDDALSE